MSEPTPIVPEDRDWTFVIADGCAECGFKPQDPPSTGALLRATLPAWQTALRRPDATTRPAPTVWSASEYGCHVRDTLRIFRDRLHLMLAEDDPVFANWDQDAAAVEGDYFRQEPADVLAAIERELPLTAAAFDGVQGEQWLRPGRRSNGSVFTVATFAVYFLHDVVHHVHDVAR